MKIKVDRSGLEKRLESVATKIIEKAKKAALEGRYHFYYPRDGASWAETTPLHKKVSAMTEGTVFVSNSKNFHDEYRITIKS